MQANGSVKNDHLVENDTCTVPTVRVCLVQDLRVLSNQCVIAEFEQEGEKEKIGDKSFLIEADHNKLRNIKMEVFDVVLQPAEKVRAHVSLVNQLVVLVDMILSSNSINVERLVIILPWYLV